MAFFPTPDQPSNGAAEFPRDGHWQGDERPGGEASHPRFPEFRVRVRVRVRVVDEGFRGLDSDHAFRRGEVVWPRDIQAYPLRRNPRVGPPLIPSAAK